MQKHTYRHFRIFRTVESSKTNLYCPSKSDISRHCKFDFPQSYSPTANVRWVNCPVHISETRGREWSTSNKWALHHHRLQSNECISTEWHLSIESLVFSLIQLASISILLFPRQCHKATKLSCLSNVATYILCLVRWSRKETTR